ncbi:MAG: GatB/YqeY domain-containing protein [Thermodesulfobacteriota bacterium]|nr:GatB/YqeY domain-containing protein [Thermodesulfobacteriota bacterium]
MTLKEQIEGALKDAIRSRDETRRNALRMLLTAMKNKEKEVRRELETAEIRQLIGAALKQRREAAELYRKGGREDLASVEERESEVLREFLPEPLSREALEALVDEVIREVGAAGPKDMGKVMQAIMPKVAGRAEGKAVNDCVRRRLTS